MTSATSMVAWTTATGLAHRTGLPRRLLPVVLVLPVVLLALSGAGAAALVDRLGGELPLTTVHLVGTVHLLGLLVALSALFTDSAFTQNDARSRWWQTMPLTDRALAAGRSAPVWYVGLLQAAFAVTAVTGLFTGVLSAPATASLVMLAVVGGVSLGRLLLTVAHLALRRGRRGWDALALPVAVVLWAALSLALTWWVREVISLALPAGSLVVAGLLGVPGLVYAGLHEMQGWSWAALVASALAVVWMEAVVLRQPPRTNRAMTDVVFVPPTYRGGPLVVAELLRLVRRKRILAVLASTMMVLGILAAALRWVPGAAGQGGTVDNAVFIVGILACYVPVLARGRTSGTPYAVVLGQDPFRWGLSVAVAGWLLALVVGTFAAGVLAVVTGDPGVAMATIAMCAFMAALGALLGSVLLASEDNAGAEALGVAAVAATTFAFGRAMGSVGIESLLTVALVLAAISPLLLVGAGVVESRRWPAGRRLTERETT